MLGRDPEEVSEYLMAARLGLKNWDLFLNLGLAYLGQREFARATEALETAVSLGPQHAEAHFNLAIVYENQNRLREALREITAARHLAPEIRMRLIRTRSSESKWETWFVRTISGRTWGPACARLRSSPCQPFDPESLLHP